uniref:Uncharacterized protein n=1 Tax=Plectus sambesii TaxID=2011161 RepID=A0A914V7B0_9BILA
PLKTVPVDVTNQESVDKAVERVTKELGSTGKLWAIVNNAGVFATYGPDDWLKSSEYEEALGVNTLGVIRVSQAFRSLLKKSKGRVVTIASVAGRLAVSTCGPYSVSKFAVVAYMDVIRNELRPFGVTCHVLEPGIFRTTLIEEKAYEKRLNFSFNRCSDAVKNEYGREFVDD